MEPDIWAALLRPDPASDETLPLQLARAIRQAALAGRLAEGDALPATRACADLLGIGRNAVITAYELLAAEGIITTAQGKRPRIAPLHLPASPAAPQAIALSQRARALPVTPTPHATRMSPGSPDPRLFPADLWGRALRRAARHRQDGAEGYTHFAGLPELRQVLADHLHRHRGLAVGPDDILITSGTQASLTLCAHGFADTGARALVENPGYRNARTAFVAAGLDCAPLPVDAQGAAPHLADFAGAKLVYVTPSTQYPAGMRMPMARRLALVAQAKAAGAVVIEDDYDSEFVWHGRGIAAIGALPDRGGVVTIGSAAKSLLPGLRIGWLVAPHGAADGLRQMHRRLGLAANVHAQAALADVMGAGSYRHHIQKISQTYHERMLTLHAALTNALPDGCALSLPDGGLQLTVTCPALADDRQWAAALQALGYGVTALSDYDMTGATKGLVVGFGLMEPREAKPFARACAAALPR